MISIIITTKNEEKNIRRILESISLQFNKNNHEVIVIDNFSIDKTVQIIEEFKFVNLFKLGPERSAQRNYGIKKSIGDIVLILDADMKLSSNLLEEINNFFKNEECDAIYIEEKIISKGLMGRVRKLERQFYIGTNVDCARAFRRNILIEVNFYNEALTGPEDWDLDNKILSTGANIKLLNKTNAYIEHFENEISIYKYLFKKNYYSKDHNKFRKLWIRTDYLKKQLGIKYRFFKIFFENKKYKLIFKNPITFLLMYVLLLMKAFVGLKNLIKNT